MNKKKLRTILLAFIAVPLAMMTSCSSDDEPQDENNKVAGTTWHSVDTNEHEVSSFFNDKTEPNTAVMTKIRQMSGLRYSVDTKVQTEDVYINLCEKSGHTNDGSMDLVFASEKCQVEVKTFRSVYKAKRTKTETVYKFEEGQYMVALGPSHYEGINVDNYGVYRANGTLYIPLDGNGCVTIETITNYTNKMIENEDVVEKTITADYQVKNNVISFSYVEGSLTGVMTAILAEDNRTMTVANNPFIPFISTFQK